MGKSKVVEVDILEKFAKNVARQYNRAKLAPALGKPVYIQGRLRNPFGLMEQFRFNRYYPSVIRTEYKTPYWIDEADSMMGKEPTGYITSQTTTSITLTNGKTKVPVSGAIILYVLASIAAGTWEPDVEPDVFKELFRIGSPYMALDYHTITLEETWGLS